MALTYLALTNRVLKALNEPEMTSTNFATVVGFDAEVKDAINQSILDIYREEEIRWPWAHSEITFETTAGVTEYNLDASVDIADWDTFQIEKPKITVSSLTSTGTTATADTATNHQLAVGDLVKVSGADQEGYNGTFAVQSVPTATQFTYTVASGLTTPATGTIIARPPYESEDLPEVTYKVWLDHYKSRDDNRDSDNYITPTNIVRSRDNNIILVGVPDRVYTIRYDAYAYPTNLVNWDDVVEIPDEYEQVIVDRALYYAYMFRDNLEQASFAKDKYKRAVDSSRRIEITRAAYARIGN